jgi:3-hydroxyisobutyrate dehydrogenase-like beta-hydroxyacid dehydrogenase
MIDAVSKGSGDSYALRNHAVKSLLPRKYPENSFPPEYKIKDLNYLLELGAELGSPLRSMQLAHSYYEEALKRGFGGRYFTVVREVIEGRDAGD